MAPAIIRHPHIQQKYANLSLPDTWELFAPHYLFYALVCVTMLQSWPS